MIGGIRQSLTILALLHITVLVHAQQQIAVQWATYLGGSGRDEARDVDCDDADNAYVCGVFGSPDFPAPRNVSGPQDNAGPGYLAKFSPDGQLLWLMWFKGFSPHEVAADGLGTVIVIGSAEIGANTLGGTQGGLQGTTDAGMVLVSSAGERLASATIGGTRDDVGTSVDIRSDRIYVAGITASTDLPTTPNAPQQNYGGGGTLGQGIGDGIVARYRIDRSAGTTSLTPEIISYYGGRYLDEILCIRARNTKGEVYIGGRTRSDNLPGGDYITSGRSGDVFNDDGFLSQLDSTLRPLWHMYMGGSGNDVVYTIQPRVEYDASGFSTAVCVTVSGVYNGGAFLFPGRSSPAFPDAAYGGGTQYGGDCFAIQTSGFFNTVRWLTAINTADDDVCVALPRNQSVYGLPLVFSNGAVGLFVKQNGINAYLWTIEFGGSRDVVERYEGNADECILDADQQRFGFGGRALRTGSRGEYFCGSTNSTLLPETDVPGKSFQQSNRGGYDGYIVRTGCSNRRPRLVATDSVLCATDTTVVAFSSPVATARWPDGSQGQSYIARTPGIVRVQYTTSNGCDVFADSVMIRAGVLPQGSLRPADTIEVCGAGDSALIILSGTNIAAVQWSGGKPLGDSAIVVTTPGSYTAVLTSSDGCASTTNTVVVRTRSIDSTLQIAATTDVADSVNIGSAFSVVLRLTGGSAIVYDPDRWTGTIQYNNSVLLPLFPLTIRQITGVDVLADVAALGMHKGDTLAVLPFRAALGETDAVDVVIRDITTFPCSVPLTDVTVPIDVAGICRANGSARFISTRAVRLTIMSVQGGTERTPLEVTAAGSEASVADAHLYTILGESIPMQRQWSDERSTSWRCLVPLSSGAYTVVVRTHRDVITTSVSIVR